MKTWHIKIEAVNFRASYWLHIKAKTQEDAEAIALEGRVGVWLINECRL